MRMKINSTVASCVIALAALSTVACGRVEAAQGDDYSKYYHDLPIDLPVVKAPVIPVYTVSITDFGGVNDGVTKNTEAFAKAMSHLAVKGGGRLIVPEGIWYTGPISFESNVELHLDRGALVLFSEDLADYPSVSSSFEGLNSYRAMSPLSAFDKENIAITGEGTFNGNGQCWRPVKVTVKGDKRLRYENKKQLDIGEVNIEECYTTYSGVSYIGVKKNEKERKNKDR